MKFFIPLGFRCGEDGNPYSNVGSVYGPYEDDEAVKEAIARLWPNDREKQFLVFDGQIVKVRPSANEKPEDEKREPGNMGNYFKDENGYKCRDCGGAILGARVAHPVHLRETPGAGFGECQYETVPYCPNCEKQPNFDGAPVSV